MSHKSPPLASRHSPRTAEARLQSLFSGYDGFGMIIYFWALIGSFIAAITLIAAASPSGTGGCYFSACSPYAAMPTWAESDKT